MDRDPVTFIYRETFGEQEVQEKISLDPDEFPLLSELLTGPEGERAEDELRRLLTKFRQGRAGRQTTDHKATFLLTDSEQDVEIPCRIEDISASGIRIAIGRDVDLDLLRLMDARFIFEVGESGSVKTIDLQAWFIRVAEVTADKISLAFRFAHISPSEIELLELVPEAELEDKRDTKPPV